MLGLTATPIPEAQAYFNNNEIAKYTYDDSVVDGVNVPARVYRIITEATVHGGTIAEGETVTDVNRAGEVIDTYTAQNRIDYAPNQLDRSVINPNQIEAVLKSYMDGNILKKRNCKRVINFDECFTTHVGEKTADINPTSICGQYLSEHPGLDVQKLIDAASITPARAKSRYQQKTRYDSGTIVPNGDDLLMAFAKLDDKGKGRFFTRDEYLRCLDLLWRGLENHYSEKDVCVPILGAGTTSFDGGSGASISQQDLLNMMTWSYKLSSHKIKAPHRLRIVCKKSRGFSINNIDK